MPAIRDLQQRIIEQFDDVAGGMGEITRQGSGTSHAGSGGGINGAAQPPDKPASMANLELLAQKMDLQKAPRDKSTADAGEADELIQQLQDLLLSAEIILPADGEMTLDSLIDGLTSERGRRSSPSRQIAILQLMQILMQMHHRHNPNDLTRRWVEQLQIMQNLMRQWQNLPPQQWNAKIEQLWANPVVGQNIKNMVVALRQSPAMPASAQHMPLKVIVRDIAISKLTVIAAIFPRMQTRELNGQIRQLQIATSALPMMAQLRQSVLSAQIIYAATIAAKNNNNAPRKIPELGYVTGRSGVVGMQKIAAIAASVAVASSPLVMPKSAIAISPNNAAVSPQSINQPAATPTQAITPNPISAIISPPPVNWSIMPQPPIIALQDTRQDVGAAKINVNILGALPPALVSISSAMAIPSQMIGQDVPTRTIAVQPIADKNLIAAIKSEIKMDAPIAKSPTNGNEARPILSSVTVSIPKPMDKPMSEVAGKDNQSAQPQKSSSNTILTTSDKPNPKPEPQKPKNQNVPPINTVANIPANTTDNPSKNTQARTAFGSPNNFTQTGESSQTKASCCDAESNPNANDESPISASPKSLRELRMRNSGRA